jgi:hypothetical protein
MILGWREQPNALIERVPGGSQPTRKSLLGNLGYGGKLPLDSAGQLHTEKDATGSS